VAPRAEARVQPRVGGIDRSWRAGRAPHARGGGDPGNL